MKFLAVGVLSILSSLFFLGPAKAEWRGHLARLFDAEEACRDIDSQACEPYLAAAVAIADLLYEQAKPDRARAEEIFLLPGGAMSVWECGLEPFKRLNGRSLTYMAIALSAPEPKNLYWTQALLGAALKDCKPAE